jgi:hypothetical protein
MLILKSTSYLYAIYQSQIIFKNNNIVINEKYTIITKTTMEEEKKKLKKNGVHENRKKTMCARGFSSAVQSGEVNIRKRKKKPTIPTKKKLLISIFI